MFCGPMIFSFLKRRDTPTRGELAARAFDLTLSDLLQLVSGQAERQAPSDCAMVVIAFRNILLEIKVLKSIEGPLPSSFADFGRMIGLLFDKYPPTDDSESKIPSEAEIKFR